MNEECHRDEVKERKRHREKGKRRHSLAGAQSRGRGEPLLGVQHQQAAYRAETHSNTHTHTHTPIGLERHRHKERQNKLLRRQIRERRPSPHMLSATLPLTDEGAQVVRDEILVSALSREVSASLSVCRIEHNTAQHITAQHITAQHSIMLYYAVLLQSTTPHSSHVNSPVQPPCRLPIETLHPPPHLYSIERMKCRTFKYGSRSWPWAGSVSRVDERASLGHTYGRVVMHW
jgi:hypothetical protein